MGKVKQENQIEIGPVKVTPLARYPSETQRRQIEDFIGRLMSFAILTIKKKKDERTGDFHKRLGRTIDNLQLVGKKMVNSPIPVFKDEMMKYAKDHSRNIYSIMKDARIPAKSRPGLLEIEGELLQVFFGIKASRMKPLPVFIKKAGPVEI